MTKKEDSAEKAIRDIRRATRRQYSAEEKIRWRQCGQALGDCADGFHAMGLQPQKGHGGNACGHHAGIFGR